MTNMLPLETWRSIFGVAPLSLWGLGGAGAPVTSKCNSYVHEYAWQETQFVGRHEIRQAIETAETRLREYLGYSVAPHYVSEVVAWHYPNVQLGEGYVQAIGVEELTLIGTPALVFSDQDGDGIEDTFTATVATAETDTEFLAAFFTVADRVDTNDEDPNRWKIAPVTITISGGNATITGRKWLLVRPILYEGYSITDALNYADAAVFVTSIAVYSRHTVSPQATLAWNSRPYPACCSTTTDPAGVATAQARVAIQDARYGIVRPAEAVYDADSASWHGVAWSGCHAPDRVTVNYYAGVPLINGQMERRWQTIVARLAAAEVGRPICCDATANRELHHWQFDVSRTGGANDESYGAVSPEDLSNPFGTRRGHIYAWKAVKHLRDLRGFLPG